LVRTPGLCAWLVVVASAACMPVHGTAQLGYARVEIAGGLALTRPGSDRVVQDVGETFGLGDGRDSPYVRVVAEVAGLELGAAGFGLREAGTGTLREAFGGLPAGSTVSSDLELATVQFSAAIPIAVGPLTIAPGALFDVFALDFRVGTDPGNREEVDEIVGLPLPFVRLCAPLGPLRATVEGGWFDARDAFGGNGRFADIAGMLECQVGGGWQLFAGGRWLSVDASGDSAGDSVAIDLELRGWFVGGGLRF
jgi:hypothetical protein